VPVRSHRDCLKVWRGWQTFHMDGHGWADIAYTLGVCQHGWVLAGRGAGVRTAAQGTNAGNDDYYAVVWLGGDGQVPSAAAVDGITWAVRELRLHGDAGLRVRPHRSFHPTECPGDRLTLVAAALDRQRIPSAGPVLPPAPAPAPPVPAPVPAPAVPEGPPDVLIVLEPKGSKQYLCDRTGASHITQGERAVLIAAGVPYVGDGDATPAERAEFLLARGVTV
jgi:hypothetical protein